MARFLDGKAEHKVYCAKKDSEHGRYCACYCADCWDDDAKRCICVHCPKDCND